MSLYTNSSAQDTVHNAFYLLSNGVNVLYLSSPFFSEANLIKEFLNKGYFIRLIVRLGPATSPSALSQLINEDKIQIRYFTSPLFHSKLYIFGDRVALIGSANLTQSGILRNREVCITINSEDNRFDKILSLYQSYWSQAEVLDADRLKKYESIYQKFKVNKENNELEQSLAEQFGDVAPTEGVQVGISKPTKEKVFLESYRKTYQAFLEAFREVETLYKKDSRRQQPEEMVPLRIEIDQFLSFIREKHTSSNNYLYQPIRQGSDREDFIKVHLEKWFSRRWQYLDKIIVKNLPIITGRLSTVSAIDAASINELLDALEICHSFYESSRYHRGGHLTLRSDFAKDNDLLQVKKVLKYLLHGDDNFIIRMCACIYDENFSLHHVGRSVVQELLGWVNRENIPICNGRTVKSLRYLGFNVVIFN